MSSSNTRADAEVSAGQAGKARSPALVGDLTAENRGPLKDPEDDKFRTVCEWCIPASLEQTCIVSDNQSIRTKTFRTDEEVVDIPDNDKEKDALLLGQAVDIGKEKRSLARQ